ncbi:MAG: DoxX family protein [Pseudobdellovibrio sp.]
MNTFKLILKIILGAFLIFAGTSHLTWARSEFLAQVPPWVPMSGDLVVVLSGIAELALGASLVFLPKYKFLAGWATAIFFVLIFPGNISQYMNKTDAFGLNSDTSRLIRLFFQPVLVAWALWATDAWRDYKTKTNR